jgi:hypothetical protein
MTPRLCKNLRLATNRACPSILNAKWGTTILNSTKKRAVFKDIRVVAGNNPQAFATFKYPIIFVAQNSTIWNLL